MKKLFLFLIITLFFAGCKEKSEKWIDNIILSESELFMAASIDLNTIIKKSELENSDNITSQQKLLFNAFNASLKSSLLGFDIETPQKIFVVANDTNLDGAVFWVGEITSEFLFEKTLKNLFKTEELSNSNLNSFFINQYNALVTFNEDYFIVGISSEKTFLESKSKSYFTIPKTTVDNPSLTNFLLNKDDVGFYVSNERINHYENNYNSSTSSFKPSSFSSFDQFGKELFGSINFLNGEIVLRIISDNSKNIIYKNIAVNSNFKKFVSFSENPISFVFSNLNLSNSTLSQNINFLYDYFPKDFIINQIFTSEEGVSSLTGEISILLFNDAKNDLNSETDENLNDDYWEDDFTEENVKIDNLPSFLMSLAVKNNEVLLNYLKIVSDDFSLNQISSFNNSFVFLQNNFLHISNNEQELRAFVQKKNLNTSTKINLTSFQKPLYGHVDLKETMKFLNLNNDNSMPFDINKLLNNISFSGNNEEFEFSLEYVDKNTNSVSSTIDFMLQNNFLEAYL